VSGVSPELVLIILIFGTINAVFLYRYLREDKKTTYTQKRTVENAKNAVGEEEGMDIFEQAAQHLYVLFDKIEELEKTVDNLDDYLSQKVEIWKKQKRVESSK